MEAPHQEFADCGGLFTRLEDDAIARDQRGDDMAVGKVSREIIRAQYRHHAMRLVSHRGGALQSAVEFFLAGSFGIGGN